MTRETAYHILTKYLTHPVLLKHSLAVEATMEALAPLFAGDREEWGITGLLHDADYEKAKNHPEKHGLLLFELEPNSIPSRIEHAIESHNFAFTKIQPESPMDWALYCCDELTGIIFSLALNHPDKKLASISTDFVLKKLQQKDFAKGANKQAIYVCEEKLGIPLQQFVDTTLKAMQRINEELEL